MTVDLSKMIPMEALQFSIGVYITEFSNLETLVAAYSAKTLDIDAKVGLFFQKELFIAQKVKILRRAANKVWGEDKAAKFRSVLNRIDKAAEFRNDLVHGAFVYPGPPDESMKPLQGKLGQDLNDVIHGLSLLDPEAVLKKAKELDQIANDLVSEFSAFGQKT